MVVDSRYTEGVWYDANAEDYCKIAQRREGAALVTPNDEDEYHEWSDNERASRRLEKDFYPVPDEAVENPVAFLVEILDLAQRRDPTLTFDDSIGVGYAREQVEISENEQ